MQTPAASTTSAQVALREARLGDGSYCFRNGSQGLVLCVSLARAGSPVNHGHSGGSLMQCVGCLQWWPSCFAVVVVWVLGGFLARADGKSCFTSKVHRTCSALVPLHLRTCTVLPVYAPFHQVLHRGGDVAHLRLKQHRGGAVEMLDLPDLAGRTFRTMDEYIRHQERHVLGLTLPLTLTCCIPHAGVRRGAHDRSGRASAGAPASASGPVPSGAVIYSPTRGEGARPTARQGGHLPQYAVVARKGKTARPAVPGVSLSDAPGPASATA